MTELRMWSQLSPSERAEAVTKARAMLDRGATRWHSVARLCGLVNGTALRKEMDPDFLEQQRAADRERVARKRATYVRPAMPFDKTARQRQTHAERGRKSARVSAMMASAARRTSSLRPSDGPDYAPVTLPRVMFLEVEL